MSSEARTPAFWVPEVEAAVDASIERAMEYALMGKHNRVSKELEQDLAMRLYQIDLKIQDFARERLLRNVLHLVADADGTPPVHQ